MQSQLTKLNHRLGAIDASSPTTIRTNVLETLRDFVPADVGLFIKCVQLQAETPHFTSLVCNGDPDFGDALMPYVDRPAFATPWLPPNLEPDEVDRFIRARERYDADHLRSFRRLHTLFEGLDVHDQLRAVLTTDNRLLGWLGLIRCGDDNSFSARQQTLLNAVVPAVKDNIVSAEILEADHIDATHRAVFRANGDIDCLSSDMEAWLTPGTREILGQMIVDIHDQQLEHHVRPFDGVQLNTLRLRSSEGMRYLVSVNRPQLLTINPSYWLTERQREVARYVISGATSPQIAEQLHVSVETIKSHIKNIFERLDISSRAELAAKLSGGSPAPDTD